MTKIFIRCILLLMLSSCRQKDRTVRRSFYYWKTRYDPSAREQQYLDTLGIRKLYVRLFDVGIDETSGALLPKGKIEWSQKPTLPVTPVVFITQEALRQSDSTGIDSLAARISRLAAQMMQGIPALPEVQIDCDWSAGTRNTYFHLLRAFKAQGFFRNKTLSVTIRLHQLKFITANGIPPADRGLLMCYNMGNLKDPDTQNSIIDPVELRKYTRSLKTYPLPLDVGLPVFDWWVLFDGRRYNGLAYLHDPSLTSLAKIDISRDTVIEGYPFKAGQWLRHERSDAASVQAVSSHIARSLRNDNVDVVLFQLDQQNLSGYTIHELETFFKPFGYGASRTTPAKRN